MFYLNCGDVQVIGASPETLCKVEGRKVYNHAIAGTVKRGKTAEGGCSSLIVEMVSLMDQRMPSSVKSFSLRRRTEQNISCLSISLEMTSTGSASPKRSKWTI